MASRRKGKTEKLASAMTIGSRMENYRRAKGLTYEDLVKACEGVWRDPWRRPVTKSYLQKLEKGRVRDLTPPPADRARLGVRAAEGGLLDAGQNVR
jgi:transcriptional regulator with XRE-family HTH domain